MPCNELVSVIIRTYNRSTELTRAVQSVLAQTYQDIEIVVVNDASTDDTAEVLHELCKRNSRVLQYDNFMGKGSAGALQTGLQVANGRYIAFLDDDDEYKREKIQCEVSCFNTNPDIDVVVSGVKTEWCSNTGNNWVRLEFQPQMLFQSISVLCKKEVFSEVSVRWGNMEWRDLAFQVYINNFNVLLTDQQHFKKSKSVHSTGMHSIKRFEIALANAQSYFEQSTGRPEHEVFQKYLANRHKCVANYSLKKNRFLKGTKHLIESFKIEGKPSNLMPFW